MLANLQQHTTTSGHRSGLWSTEVRLSCPQEHDRRHGTESKAQRRAHKQTLIKLDGYEALVHHRQTPPQIQIAAPRPWIHQHTPSNNMRPQSGVRLDWCVGRAPQLSSKRTKLRRDGKPSERSSQNNLTPMVENPWTQHWPFTSQPRSQTSVTKNSWEYIQDTNQQLAGTKRSARSGGACRSYRPVEERTSRCDNELTNLTTSHPKPGEWWVRGHLSAPRRDERIS